MRRFFQGNTIRISYCLDVHDVATRQQVPGPPVQPGWHRMAPWNLVLRKPLSLLACRDLVYLSSLILQRDATEKVPVDARRSHTRDNKREAGLGMVAWVGSKDVAAMNCGWLEAGRSTCHPPFSPFLSSPSVAGLGRCSRPAG